MKRALVLIGSPRGKRSNSTSLGRHLSDLFEKKGLETEILWLNRQVKDSEGLTRMFDSVGSADIVILIAPLYDDCQPYIVTRAMEVVAGQKMNLENKRFIPIINCGFPEPEQITAVAIDIYHKFAKTVGFKWGGSLAIGGGEMLQGATGKSLDDVGKMANKVKNELVKIADALAAGASNPDRSIRAIPDFFYKRWAAKMILRFSNWSWKSRAKKNGGVVDARPFSQ